VPADILLLADRNFHSFELWRSAQVGGSELLLRVQKEPRLPMTQVLPDGSYLSVMLPRRGHNKKATVSVASVVSRGGPLAVSYAIICPSEIDHGSVVLPPPSAKINACVPISPPRRWAETL